MSSCDAAGAPTSPAELGLRVEDLRATYVRARMIRSRYTALDLAYEAGILEEIVDELFAPGGYWARVLALDFSSAILRRPDRLYDGYVFDLNGTVYLGRASRGGRPVSCCDQVPWRARASLWRTGSTAVRTSRAPLWDGATLRLSAVGI